MQSTKPWIYKDSPDDKADYYCSTFGIKSLLAKILLSRGFEDEQEIIKFLKPTIDDLYDPFLFKDMAKAVVRIINAIEMRERILIYGDYDVDGITSTAMLYKFLASQGASVDYYIPDRIDEGYGLSVNAIEKIMLSKPSLIISVDCGITAISEVELINSYNAEIIITDHHICRETLPEAYALINPCIPDCEYPFKELAGAGVTFKLICALCKQMELGALYYEYLDIAAIGTIGDVVPLIGENRILAKAGLEALKSTRNPGLKALLEASSAADRPINSWTVSFTLGPRINAAGRMGDAKRAVRLFITDSEEEAKYLASMLNEDNKARQSIENEILNQAVEIIERTADIKKARIIIVAGENWHHGVIGIVCSRITEKYRKPCILLSREDDVCKGSGRSIEGLNIFKALTYCSDLLEKFGGHELAAGLTLHSHNLDLFRQKVNEYADSVAAYGEYLPKLYIDAKINKEAMTIDSIKELELLEPFGAGNPSPVFLCNDFCINELRHVGENKHLKLKLYNGSFVVDAIGFGMGSLISSFSPDDRIEIAFTPEINQWMSNEKIQLNVKDLKLSNELYLEREYYNTLENCISEDYNTIFDIPLNGENESILAESFGTGLRTAILVNSLQSLSEISTFINNYSKDIKINHRICYTCFDEITEDTTIYVIVNPSARLMDFSEFGKVIVYGSWIDRYYLKELLNKVDMSKSVLVKVNNNMGEALNDIVPDRKDLGSVYQYIKANMGQSFRIGSYGALAKEIASRCNIRMNYFKLKKSFEVFEELSLITKNPAEGGSIEIKLSNNSGYKTSLDKSSIYKRLQALKIAE